MPNRTVVDVGERALIARISARLAMPPWVVVGPGDDAAVIEPESGALEVLTTDAQVEGVHFDRRFVPPDAIGHRALAVNLSDLAAMGARPRAALLSLAMPDGLEVSAVDGIVDGLLTLAAQFRVALVGGNITRSPGPLVVDVTAVGSVHRRRVLTRGGARPGDAVFVTGTVGDAAVGLRLLQPADGRNGSDAPEGLPEAADQPLAAGGGTGSVRRYLKPDPRVRAGVVLGRNRVASSCMDLSDGLADAVRQVSEASGVGMVLDASLFPLTDEVRRWHREHGGNAVETALVGGDDYELLFTVPHRHRGRLRTARQQIGGLAVTRIGVVTKERRVVVKEEEGTREIPAGFEHFR